MALFFMWVLLASALSSLALQLRAPVGVHCRLKHVRLPSCLLSSAGGLYPAKEADPSTVSSSPGVGGGTASLPISSVNLLKNMVGAGVFSINSKVTAVSSSPAMVLPAALLIVTMAAWATYNFYMVGETCKMTNSSTYGEAWGRTVGEETQWIVQGVVVVAPIVSCLANTIVLSDVLGLVLKSAGLPLWLYGNRNVVIGLLSSLILYPLCIQKDLSALKSVSAFGIAGHLSAMFALVVRLADKSYLPGGAYYAGSAMQKAALLAAVPVKKASAVKLATAATAAAFAPEKIFVLASLLSYCFVCHYNAPRYYSELKGKEKDPNLFLKMTSLSYASGAAIYIGTMLLALALFGRHSQSFALNSFSTLDPLGTFARVAFGSSVLASFPLIFLSMRNWFSALAEQRLPVVAGVEKMSALLLLFISYLTSQFTDIGVVGSIAGAVFGSSMMFIFPPVMYIKALQQQAAKRGEKTNFSTLAINGALLACGSALGLLGTYNSLSLLWK